MELNILNALNLKHAISNTLSIIKKLGEDNICVVVPDKLSATMEKTIFEQLNLESSFNINVSTLNRLSRNVLNETKAKYRTISKIGSIILLKKVLNDNKEIISNFQHSHHSYQYSNEIFKTLAQLKSCQLGSEELLKYRCNNSQLQQKINDLGNILELYNQAKVGVLDNSDTLTLTCMMLSESKTVKNTNYIFVGFDDFTSQGYDLIERLIRFSKSIYVNCYVSQNPNHNIYYQDVFYRLNKTCALLEIKVNTLTLPYTDSNLHTYLTNNLFSFNKLNFNLKYGDEIRLYQAQNLQDELDFVARDIRCKILKGDRYRDFGIAVFDLKSNAELVKQVFDKYDLCTYIDVQKSFSTTCIYRFFTNFWQLYSKNYETINLIEFINSPFINLADADKAKIIARIKLIEYRGDFSNLDCGDELKPSIQYLSNIITKNKLTNESNIDDILVWHTNIIKELNIEEIVNNLVNNIEDSYDKKILSQAIKSSNLLLQEIAEFYNTSCLKDVLDIYSQAGVEQGISPLPLSVDCIQVVDAAEILSTFKNLYLVNCNSSTAPSTMQDIGVLLDKELSYVQLSHNIEPSIARINRLNKFKLFNSSLMFEDSLCITMSLRNVSETSNLVHELKHRIFTSNTVQGENNISYLFPQPIKPEQEYLPLSLWDLIEYVYTKNAIVSEFVHKILQSRSISLNSTKIEVDRHFTQLTEISATALETYFQCPMQYFFTYVLKLKTNESNEIEMLDIGNILHEVAQRYYLNKNREQLNIDNFCDYTINKILDRNEKLKLHSNSPIIINLIAECKRFIYYLKHLDENCDFIPTYFEKNFGNNQEFEGLPLTDKVGLKGKIDRIDIYGDYFRIIDYKSGNPDPSLQELYYGKKLQLFLYALAVANLTNKRLSGLFYLPIKNVVEKNSNDENIYKLLGFYTDNIELAKAYDKNLLQNGKSEFVNMSVNADGSLSKRSNKVLTDSAITNMLNYAKNISIKALQQIDKGVFNPSPIKFDSQHNACAYCPYLVLCSKFSHNVQFRNVCKVNQSSFKGGNDE